MAYTEETDSLYHTSGSVGAATHAMDYSIPFKMSTYSQIEREDGQNIIQSSFETKMEQLTTRLMTLAEEAKLPMAENILKIAQRMLENHLTSIARSEHAPGARFTRRNFNVNILEKMDTIDTEKLLRNATLFMLTMPLRKEAKENPSGLERQAFRGALSWLESRDWSPVPLHVVPFLVKDTLKRSRAAVVALPDNGMFASVSASTGAATKAKTPGFSARLSSFVDAARDNRELKQGLLRFKVFSKKEDFASRLEKLILHAGIKSADEIKDRAIGMLEKQFTAIDRDHRAPSLIFESRTWRLSILDALDAINPKEIARKAAVYVLSQKIEEQSRTSDDATVREASRLTMTWLDFQENDKIPLRAIPMHIDRTYRRAENEILSIKGDRSPPVGHDFS